MMPLFRPRVLPIEARRFVWGSESAKEIMGWSGWLIHYTPTMAWDEQNRLYYCDECNSHFFSINPVPNALVVPHTGGDQIANPGDWIVRETEARVFYVLTDDAFHMKFEEIP